MEFVYSKKIKKNISMGMGTMSMLNNKQYSDTEHSSSNPHSLIFFPDMLFIYKDSEMWALGQQRPFVLYNFNAVTEPYLCCNDGIICVFISFYNGYYCLLNIIVQWIIFYLNINSI